MMCRKLLNCRHIYSFGNAILAIFKADQQIDTSINQSLFSNIKEKHANRFLLVEKTHIVGHFLIEVSDIKADGSKANATKGYMS